MTNIIFYDINGERVDSLYQWNYNVSIKIGGAKTEPAPEIWCWNKNSKVANRVKAEISNGFVKFVIPNELLQDCFPINIQLFYCYDSGDSKTEYHVVIPVSPGKKPDGYVYSPTEIATLDALEKRIDAIEKGGGNTSGGSGGSSDTTYPAEQSAKICTFLDAYAAWCNGEAFPVAFYGDSTFRVANTSTRYFCERLQEMLREECGANAVIHNAGVSGKNLDYGIQNFDANFGEGGTYADSKMVGIGFGINDRLAYTTYSDYKKGVYAKLETLIHKCIDRGIQPFLVTSQATTECGVSENYAVQYPLRDSNSINLCANGAKKELAEKYGIPLVDLNRATEQYLLHSGVPVNTIIPDRLHFGDVGQAFEAGFLFAQFVPRVVQIDGKTEHVLSYASQNLRSAVPENRLSYGGRLKLSANYTRESGEDVRIFDAYVYVSDHPAALRAYRNTADATSYIKIDGVSCGMVAADVDLSAIDVGLHHLEAYSGTGTLVDFAGFTVNEAVTEAASPRVLCDTTAFQGDELAFQSMAEGTVPAVLMAGFDSTTSTNLLSGRCIDSIYLKVNAGSLTIGKFDLTKFGTGEASLIGGKTYTITADGYTTIPLDGLSIGANETLAVGSPGDTALLHYIPTYAKPDSNALLALAGVFNSGTTPAIGMKFRVIGR